MFKNFWYLFVIFFVISCATTIAVSEEKSEKVPSLNLVIYNRDFGLVNENITVPVKTGISEFSIENIARQIDPLSVILNIESDKNEVRILEQKFVSDVLSQQMLLDKYEGQEINFETVVENTGERFVRKGKIIRAGNNPIIKIDGIYRFGLPGTPLFDNLPEISLLKPTLIWQIKSEKTSNENMTLSYMTRGFSWETNYNAVILDDEKHIELYAWFVINNNTGRDYKNAQAVLLAGDVNRIQNNQMHAPMARKMVMAVESYAVHDDVSIEALDDFYVFNIDRKLDLDNRETKQIEFLSSSSVPIKRTYKYEGQHGQGVQIIITIKNDEESNLGISLPAGKMKIYRTYNNDFNIFTGEDRINHTPVNEEIELNIGKAFDLTGERIVKESKRIGTREIEETYQITLRNQKKEKVNIIVSERINRADWNMIRHSDPYEQIDSQRIEFNVAVKPESEKTVSYTIRMRW